MTSQELVNCLLDGKTLTHNFFGRNGRVHMLNLAEEHDAYKRLVVVYRDGEIGWNRQTYKETLECSKTENFLKHIYIDTLNIHRDNTLMMPEQYQLLKNAYKESGWSIWEPTDDV